MLRYEAQTGTLRRVPVVVVIQVERNIGVEIVLPRTILSSRARLLTVRPEGEFHGAA